MFFVLFLVSVFLTINSHSYHKNQYVNSANFISGGVFSIKSSITDYFDLKDQNKKLTEENRLLRLHLQNIEERFAAIEASVDLLSTSKTQVQDMEEAIAMLRTSVSAINNTIDKNLILEVREASNEVTTIAVDVSGLQSLFESLKETIEDIEDDLEDIEDQLDEVSDKADKNPLAN